MASARSLAAVGFAGALVGAAITAAWMRVSAKTVAVVAVPGAGRSDAEPAGGPPLPRIATEPPSGARLAAPAKPREASGDPTLAQLLAKALDSVEVALPEPGHGTITGHVTTKDGEPLPGATVSAWATLPVSMWSPEEVAAPSAADLFREWAPYVKWRLATQRETKTDRSGAYTLSDLSSAELRSPWTLLKVDAKNSPLTLTLAQRSVIQGIVKWDPVDVAWEYVRVTARSLGAPEGERPLQTSARPPDWSFRFEDLDPGAYEIVIGHDETAVRLRETVEARGGTLARTFAIPAPTASQVLVVRVFSPAGPIAADENVSFSTSERTKSRTSSTGLRSARRADGAFLVALVKPREASAQRALQIGVPIAASTDAEGPVTWFLMVTTGAHGRKEVEFDFGSTQSLEVRLE